MIGLVHVILFGLIEEAAGPEAPGAVRDLAGIPPEKTFHLDSVYDDEEWRRLLGAACEYLELTPAQAVEAYARYFLRDSQRRFPRWWEMSRTAKELLLRQPVIHNCFASGLRDPAARRMVEDKFSVEDLGASLLVRYASPNRHCALYMVLARLVLEHYGERAEVVEERCMQDGAPACSIRITWEEV